jgi:hypothetical protein
MLFVCFSALEYCLNVENMNLSAIRTIRVLRPLRAINRIPSKCSNFQYGDLMMKENKGAGSTRTRLPVES